MDLAYELLDGYERTILVDATPRGGAPGTIYVIEPDTDTVGEGAAQPAATAEACLIDAHAMEPVSMFALIKALDGRMDRVLIVGSERAAVEEGIGLSEPLAQAVDEAVCMIHDPIAEPSREMAAATARGGQSERGESV